MTTCEDILSLAVPTPREPDSDAEWDLEQRAFYGANNFKLPDDTRTLIADLWAEVVARENWFAAPTPPAAEAPGQEPVADLDSRMIAAGMIPLSELLKGSPLDKWIAHSGLQTLDHFEEWLSSKRREYMQMRVAYELGDKDEQDELYEWVFAHAAVFGEVIVNYRAVKAQTVSAPPTYADAEAKGFEGIAPDDVTIMHSYINQNYRVSVFNLPSLDRARAVAAAIRSLASPAPKGETERPPYPTGHVVGPCVCGSWPGGPCLKCEWRPAPPAVAKEEEDERHSSHRAGSIPRENHRGQQPNDPA